MKTDTLINPDIITGLLHDAKVPERFEHLHELASRSNRLLHLTHKALLEIAGVEKLDDTTVQALDFGAQAYELFGAHIGYSKKIDIIAAVTSVARFNGRLATSTAFLSEHGQSLIKSSPRLAEGIVSLCVDYQQELLDPVLGSAGIMQAAHREINQEVYSFRSDEMTAR